MQDKRSLTTGKVLRFQERRPREALERLRRLTGLAWHSYPESQLSATWIRPVER